MAIDFKNVSSSSQGASKVLLGINESDSTGFTFNTFEVSSIYNVKKYGAKGDGSTDDTTSIQNAINAAVAGGGGIVYFPNGVYIVGGALQSGYNSQLYVEPATNFADPPSQISFIGESQPAFRHWQYNESQSVPATGAVIKSTITGSGTRPSIFATQKASDWGFNNVGVYFENLRILTTVNGSSSCTMTALNLERFHQASARYIIIQQNISSGLITTPGDDTVGIRMPVNNGASPMILEGTTVSGFKHGYLIAEHTILNNVQAQVCYNGITQVPNYHQSTYLRVKLPNCVNPLNTDLTNLTRVTDGGQPSTCNISVICLDSEWRQVGEWFDIDYVVNDPSNVLRGTCGYHMIQGGIGIANGQFNKNGGTGFLCYALHPQNGATDFTVSGSTGGNVALQNLLAKLEERGIIIDSTT